VKQGVNFPHPAVKQGANFPHPTVKQGENFPGKFTSYTQEGCELPSGYSQVGCEPPMEEGLQELSFGLDNIQICNIFLVRHLIQDRKCISMA
jgi:hypothetical protein